MSLDKLPNELKIEVLSYLGMTDLLNIYYSTKWSFLVLPILNKKYPDIYKNSIREFLTTKIFLTGSVNSFRYLHDKKWIISYQDISSVAIHSGYIDILDFMKKNNLPFAENLQEMCDIGKNEESKKWIIG